MPPHNSEATHSQGSQETSFHTYKLLTGKKFIHTRYIYQEVENGHHPFDLSSSFNRSKNFYPCRLTWENLTESANISSVSPRCYPHDYKSPPFLTPHPPLTIFTSFYIYCQPQLLSFPVLCSALIRQTLSSVISVNSRPCQYPHPPVSIPLLLPATISVSHEIPHLNPES